MQRLSTSRTYFYKVVLPIAVTLMYLGVFIFFTSLEIALIGIVSFIVSGIIFSFILLLNLYSIKKVSIDDDFLYVSNFKKEIEIPLSQISSVSGNIWGLPRKITIRLNEPSVFGKKITFLGYHVFFLFFTTHPAVEEIRNKIVNNSKANSE